jgi:hypothetical protein
MVSEPLWPILPAELELQALWFAGAFGRDFTTIDGKSVRVVQFGEWNRGAGPDFQHGAIVLDGVECTGSLELDPHAADWENHQHATNPAYRNVVLHVSFRAEDRVHFIRNDEHRQIPQVVIGHEALAQALLRPRRETAIARSGRCVTPLQAMPPLVVNALLREAAEHRAMLKTRRFLQTADAHGRDAALFQAVAQTLGYRSIPDAVEAVLFGCSGFLSADMHEKATGWTREYLSELWQTWWKHRANFESTRPIPWKMHGQRPANHPHRRVAALAVLAQHWPAFRKVALARPFSAKRVIEHLASLEHPFWQKHHTLASAATPQEISIFGKSQALELIANHLAPLAMQEDATFDFEKFATLRSSTINEKVRRAGIRLFGSEILAKPWQKTLAHQQALLQIYRDFCLEDFSDCAQCPFPEQLAQWQP